MHITDDEMDDEQNGTHNKRQEQEGDTASMGSEDASAEPLIGQLTHKERQEKVLKFIMRKRMKTHGKKFTYECRKQVAEKRLRIKGRFVTKLQAFQILGITEADENSNENLQKLLEQHYNINQNGSGTFSQVSSIMHQQLSKRAKEGI